MLRRGAQIVAAGLLAASTCGVAAEETVYTPLKPCPAARLAYDGRVFDQGVRRCKGAGGYSVYVLGDDVRSWLMLERGGRLQSLEAEMNSRFEPGHFPTVEESRVLEWRIDRGAPVALIVRVAYQDRDDAFKAGSVLVVYDLTGPQPRFLGYHKTNEAARRAADSAGR